MDLPRTMQRFQLDLRGVAALCALYKQLKSHTESEKEGEREVAT